jgi:transposase InsO family protein
VQLHVRHPQLGSGQLRHLAARLLGFHASRDTFRRIVMRRRDLVVAAQGSGRSRRIRVRRRGELWGAEVTQVLVLGFFPIAVLGVVDYFGSRLVAFEPIGWETSTSVVRALDAAFQRHGAPARLLTDRGRVMCSGPVEALLVRRGVRHTLTLPQHPWTNGRIERVFRLFKETVFGLVWLVASPAQLATFCSDFTQWHNRDRPHGGWNGLTPDEVYFGRPRCLRFLGSTAYFGGRLSWYRFG